MPTILFAISHTFSFASSSLTNLIYCPRATHPKSLYMHAYSFSYIQKVYICIHFSYSLIRKSQPNYSTQHITPTDFIRNYGIKFIVKILAKFNSLFIWPKSEVYKQWIEFILNTNKSYGVIFGPRTKFMTWLKF